MNEQPSTEPVGWSSCRDDEHGFALRHPADWVATGPTGRCVGFQRGEPSLPEGVPPVDVFIRVLPVEAEFPDAYLRTEGELPQPQAPQVGRGVAYTDRVELDVNGLPAVRARFRTAGPTPNWGVEYAIRNDDLILDAYASQPSKEVEAEFDEVMRTLEW